MGLAAANKFQQGSDGLFRSWSNLYKSGQTWRFYSSCSSDYLRDLKEKRSKAATKNQLNWIFRLFSKIILADCRTIS